jgi:hypothetical protein
MHVSIEADIRVPRLSTHRRRLAAALMSAFVVLVPGSVLGSHQFTDVPADHTFHDDIGALYGARITAGCSPTTFCPDAPVTRGQMAAFLNRAIPRVAFGSVSGSSSGTQTTVGQIKIKPGNPPGGFQYVIITATVDAYVNGAGCPCESTIGIYRGDSQVSPLMYMDMVPTQLGDGDTDDVATVIGVSIVPTGVEQTYNIRLQRLVGSSTVNAYGTIIATSYPFNGEGNSPVRAEAFGDGLAEFPGKPGD